MKKLISMLLVVTFVLSTFAFPVTTFAEEEMVDVYSVHNAEFKVMSSTNMEDAKWPMMPRPGDGVFDRDFITTAGSKEFSHIKSLDINGKAGDDFIVVMDIAASIDMPIDTLKIFWEQGTPYQEGPIGYMNKPTRAWPVDFGIYASETGKDDTWELVYYKDSLEGMLDKEQVVPDIWDDSEGWKTFYEFEFDKPVTSKNIRLAFGGMEPFMNDIQIHEIFGYSKLSALPADYHKINVKADDTITYDIIDANQISEDYSKAGAEVVFVATPDEVTQINDVKLDGKSLKATVNEETGEHTYSFTMPSAEATIEVLSGIRDDENVEVKVVSSEVAGGDVVAAGIVPVVTFNFNRKIDFVDKSMVKVNGERRDDLIQHAFKDAVDNTKVYVVPFRDMLADSTTYKIEVNGLKSLAGKDVVGEVVESFTTAADFTRDLSADKQSYINGYGNNMFGPEDNITLEHALLIAGRLAADKDFSSIPSLDRPATRMEIAKIVYIMKYGKALASDKDMFTTMINDGILKGYEDGTYRENANITRAEIVALFNRVTERNVYKPDGTTYETDGTHFADVADNHWAALEIYAATSDVGSTRLPWTENIPEVEFDVMNESDQVWEQIPAVSQELRDKGSLGGEGGQWMQAIECDTIDGQLLLGGVDIAGLIRSTDGGKTWHRSFRGWAATGACDFEIDPTNKNRIIGIGHASNKPYCGIYLSEDMGYSWTQVYSYIFNGQRDTRKQLAWDASSYDEEIGGSRIGYWSPMWRIYAGLENGAGEYTDNRYLNKEHGLMKTEDGGKTWFVVNEEMTDSVVEVNPESGVVYCSNESGFWRSEDGGVTFDLILDGEPIYGLDVIHTYPNNVYVNDKDGILISTDSGKTFERVPATGFPERPTTDVRDMVRDLAVSPANPNNMMVDSRNYHKYQNKRFYSNDGGKTWAESAYDDSLDFFFNHSRQHPYAWHPTDENKVWSLGGDWVTSSTNAGQTFIWDANGYCGTPPGGRINFNPFKTNMILAGAQDLTGLLTKNGGYTWEPLEPSSGGGFGCSYGNICVDEQTLVAAIAPSWTGLRELQVSYDGGETFINTGLPLKYGVSRAATSFWTSTNDRDTFFAGEYVTRDRAKTWKEMDGCMYVMAVNYYHNREAYGINGIGQEYIVVSYDNGDTWLNFHKILLDDEEARNMVASQWSSGVGMHTWDVEYDGQKDIIYYVTGSINSAHSLVKVQNNVPKNIGGNVLTQDLHGDKWYQLIALDPRYPDVLYLGGYGAGSMKCTNSVQRSCDGGETFQILSSMGDSNSIVPSGPATGASAETIVVHPETGEVWLWTQAEGMWKFPAPYAE